MVTPVKTHRFVLASSSLRRRELLEEAGYDFEVIAPSVSEPDSALSKLRPNQQAEALAYFKARTVADEHADMCVLGADTVVAVHERVLGKPGNRPEAEEMLRTLSGSRHAVITALALLRPDGRRLIASETTYVTMREMTDREIEQYLESGEWMGKAGAYAIQETADRFVDRVEGSFTNVVGLPMELLERMMREIAKAPIAPRGI